jgi:beta-glucosidase
MGPIDHDQLGEAIDLAAKCDVSVVVVGTNDDWESEGWDREDIDLPGKQDILIHEVAKVSKRTIVVINAGSPVAMPWLNEVDAVLFTWFAGQEMGDALVDVLLGDVEPSGRLPVTMPRRMEDTPAAEHHPGRNGVAKYLEGRLIGYRWYDTIGREPQFPFGFGLGYADVLVTDAASSGTHMVTTTLQNTSQRDGVQVVHVSLSLRAHR